MQTSQNDPFNLARFIYIQNAVYDTVVNSLKRGEFKAEWMWFIFPEITGRSASKQARHFSIKSTKERDEYLMHPILMNHLLECTALVSHIKDKSLVQIFGFKGNKKFLASMTLFASCSSSNLFISTVQNHYMGYYDKLTMRILNRMNRTLSIHNAQKSAKMFLCKNLILHNEKKSEQAYISYHSNNYHAFSFSFGSNIREYVLVSKESGEAYIHSPYPMIIDEPKMPKK